MLFTKKPKFELDGADVQFDVAAGMSVYVKEQVDYYNISTAPRSGLLSYAFEKQYRVEVKPFVGDDYPVILRSMVAKSCNLLLAEAFEADGATWEQVTQVFASRNIRVCLLEDVLLTPIPETVRSLPLPQVDKTALWALAEEALERHHEGTLKARVDFNARWGTKAK